MPNRTTLDEREKYDHSSHPTTHRKPEDMAVHSNAKVDDSADSRGVERFPGKPQRTRAKR